MEFSVINIGFAIAIIGIVLIVILEFIPKEYTLSRGGQATSIKKLHPVFRMPSHMLTKLAKKLRNYSIVLVVVGLTLPFLYFAFTQ